MSRTSALPRIENDPLVIIRRSHLRVCGGDHAAAALLSVLDYWDSVKRGSIEQDEIRARSDPEYVPAPRDGCWIYKSYEDLERDLLGLYARKKIAAAVQVLTAKGFVELRSNPKNPSDRTKQYRLRVDRIKEALGASPQVAESDQSSKRDDQSPKTAALQNPKRDSLPYRDSEITEQREQAGVGTSIVCEIPEQQPPACASEDEKPGKPGKPGNAPEWPDELVPIRESLREHAQAIGQEPELERDLELGARLAAAAGGNAYAAAALIGKLCYRRYGPHAPHPQPWPQRLGFWVRVLLEELGKPQSPAVVNMPARKPAGGSSPWAVRGGAGAAEEIPAAPPPNHGPRGPGGLRPAGDVGLLTAIAAGAF